MPLTSVTFIRKHKELPQREHDKALVASIMDEVLPALAKYHKQREQDDAKYRHFPTLEVDWITL